MKYSELRTLLICINMTNEFTKILSENGFIKETDIYGEEHWRKGEVEIILEAYYNNTFYLNKGGEEIRLELDSALNLIQGNTLDEYLDLFKI